MQFLLYVAIAIIIGLAVSAVFGFKTPGGNIGAIIAGLLGAWIGGLLIKNIGPTVGGEYFIIPGMLGALLFVLIIIILGRKANIVK